MATWQGKEDDIKTDLTEVVHKDELCMELAQDHVL
jgi:hypothetical protein